jgi:hypothetical protein
MRRLFATGQAIKTVKRFLSGIAAVIALAQQGRHGWSRGVGEGAVPVAS